MADDMGEKTEEPTAKKLAEARDKGQVAKSQDLSAAIIMTGATLMLVLLGPGIFAAMFNLTRFCLTEEQLATGLDAASTQGDLFIIGDEIVRTLIPVMFIMTVVSALAIILQIGIQLSPKAMQPKLEKLNPQKGLARLFSKRSAVRATLDVLKFVALAVAAGFAIRVYIDELTYLVLLQPIEAIVIASQIIIKVGIAVLLVLILLGILDLSYQRWQHTQDLKMTKHEVKDERKSMEGNPEIKQQRAKIAREIASQRLSRDVPTADVVVTNPTHVSVALRYDQHSMHAPVIAAMGADYVALRIRQIAAAHAIPIIERPPLARALYARCDVGDEIPESAYEAVAEVLAYVYELEGRAPERNPEPQAASIT